MFITGILAYMCANFITSVISVAVSFTNFLPGYESHFPISSMYGDFFNWIMKVMNFIL